jgi:hypothetical protein
MENGFSSGAIPETACSPDLRGNHNVHYTLKPDGALTLTRDE